LVGLPYRWVVPGERILIVEDDERIGSSLLRALESSVYDARWEQTGRGALTAVAATRPDLVLLDLGLPDMDGSGSVTSWTGDVVLVSIPAVGQLPVTPDATRAVLSGVIRVFGLSGRRNNHSTGTR